MFPKKTVEQKLNIQIATSAIMDNAVSLWLQMYQNHPPWAGGKDHVRPLNLPASIAEEMARLTLTEFSLEVTGSERGNFINSQMTSYKENISNIVEMWAVLGGIAFKPYVVGDDGSGHPTEIHVDVVPASRFYPTAFDSNKNVTGAVFVETRHIGDYIYTRLEHHNLEGTHYTVVNKAYRSERLNSSWTETGVISCNAPLQTEVALESISDWSALAPVTEIDNIDRPLFCYVKMPRANSIDPESPLGVSVFSKAVETIEEADKQYSRILWEYQATEAGVFADASLFQQDKCGRVILAEGENRLFRTFEMDNQNQSSQTLLKEYGPTIRDTSLFNGLNQLMRKIELQCGLAYGTLSDVNDAAKTATEIKMSKQRSYTTINAMQKAWEIGLNQMVSAMDLICTLYDLAPEGNLEVTCTWGDGVLEDTEVEYARRYSMVSAGLMRKEMFLAWYFGISEEEAKTYLPGETPDEEEVLDETEE